MVVKLYGGNVESVTVTARNFLIKQNANFVLNAVSIIIPFPFKNRKSYYIGIMKRIRYHLIESPLGLKSFFYWTCDKGHTFMTTIKALTRKVGKRSPALER